MTRIYKPITRRTARIPGPIGFVVCLHPKWLTIQEGGNLTHTPIRTEMTRETGSHDRGQVIVVELRMRTVALRLKGSRKEMEIGYARLDAELKHRNYSQITYSSLVEILSRRDAELESREQFLNRRSA